MNEQHNLQINGTLDFPFNKIIMKRWLLIVLNHKSTLLFVS